jgi:MoxR-like ATPase
MVCQKVNKFFPLSSSVNGEATSACDITVVEGSVRIGSIYMTQGNAFSDASQLEHTKVTMTQLEMLAAAAQSQRAVLLEGDTCSRKTALVRELARITRHELIILPMNEDTETSDIIGQWLPMTAKDGKSSFRLQIREIIKVIMRSVVLCCSDLKGKDQALREAFNIISRSFDHFDTDAPASSTSESLRLDHDVVLNISCALSTICGEYKASPRVYHTFMGHQRKVTELLELISDVLNREQDSGIAFSFIKAEFVKAIENGWWVLLDNINSAPPEVVERLNSLLEELPMLNLYEYADGNVLTRDNHGIHTDFRFFATANIYRKNSNKLSPAFLNRMVRIWLPRMDAELMMTSDKSLPDVSKSDMMELIQMQLAGVSGGRELCLILLRFHQALRCPKTNHNKVQFVTGFHLSYRGVQQTVRTLLYHLRQQDSSAVHSLIGSICRNYMSAASSPGDVERMADILIKELRKPDVMHNEAGGYRALPAPLQEMTAKYQMEARDAISLMSAFEEKLFHLADSVLLELCTNMQTVHLEAIGFVKPLFEHMYGERKPTDLIVSQLLEKLKPMEQAPQNFGRWLVENVQDLVKNKPPVSEKNIFVRGLVQLTHRVRDAIFTYLERASFQDLQDRAGEIRRMRTILVRFANVFKFEGKLSTSPIQLGLNTLLVGASSAVSRLEAVTTCALSWTDSMQLSDLS